MILSATTLLGLTAAQLPLLGTRRVPHSHVLAGTSTSNAGDVAVPSAAQLAWMELEIGANICWGIGLPNAPWIPTPDPNLYSCYGNLTAPPAALFNSTPHFQQWATAFVAMGARYSVFPASGGCGYAAWPSNATFPDGQRYNYSVRESPLLKSRDIVGEYVATMRKAGIGAGIYFQLFYDYWGGYLHGKMSPNGLGGPKLTAEQYFNVTTQQLAEVWGNYGNMTELWCATSLSPRTFFRSDVCRF